MGIMDANGEGLWQSLNSNSIVYFTRTSPKVVPPFLLCSPTTSETDAGGMAGEVEYSHQYPVTCCCCVTDGSRGAAGQKGVWHGSRDGAKVWYWIPPGRKNDPHCHSVTPGGSWWRPTSGSEHSEVGAVHSSSGGSGWALLMQSWMGAEYGSPAKMHS